MLKAIGLNCTLKGGGAQSSTELLVTQVLQELEKHGVLAGEILRMVNYDIKPGVTTDEGPGDDWPMLRQKILEADILVFGTPIWLGQPCSVAKRVLERMDAFFSDMDDAGYMPPYNKVALVAVVGNEDGAHHVTAELFQALNDVGFTLSAGASTYWVGEALQKTDFKDLKETPEMVAKTTSYAARNAAYLAKLLKTSPYPPTR